MTSGDETHAHRIRQLFASAKCEIVLVAPFIKTAALERLLGNVPLKVPIRCVTRWRADEIAAGVSDPEVFDILAQRGNCELSLVDNLHAKLYISDQRCLVGSANVTLPGLGEIPGSNIEVLVETAIDNPDVVSVLTEIGRVETVASPGLALAARAMANSLANAGDKLPRASSWFPYSRKPERAFDLYRKAPAGFVTGADRLVMLDVDRAKIPGALDQTRFRSAVRAKLAEIPLAQSLLAGRSDMIVTRADAQSYLESLQIGEYSTRELWLAFVSWMTHYLSEQVIRHEIAEVALRRAQVID